MKKICCYTGIMLCVFHFSIAQDTLKVTAKHITTELNVNLFQGTLSLNNALNQIKVRYFLSDRFALRTAFNINTRSLNTDNVSPYGANPYTINEKKKTSTVGLNVGVEKHYKGTKRLSPYWGAELAIASKSSKQTTTSGNITTTIKNAWGASVNPGLYSYTEIGYVKYGVNLIGGFDFYLAKNFYTGYEIAFSFSKTKYKDVDVTITNSPQNYPDTKQSEVAIGPTLINGIRLGYIF